MARLATVVVVRRPALWRLFRGPLRRQFDQLAATWGTRHAPGRLEPFERALERIEHAPEEALDLGTGAGAGAFAIARRFPDAHVLGVDLSEGMLEQARLQTPPELRDRVRFEPADASALPFADGRFQLVGLSNMIPFFDELARVVAPGGSVVFGFSLGPSTPIYVTPERLRTELGRRGFADFEELEAADGTAMIARKQG
jgi:SAM-dependent methyltransferase